VLLHSVAFVRCQITWTFSRTFCRFVITFSTFITVNRRGSSWHTCRNLHKTSRSSWQHENENLTILVMTMTQLFLNSLRYTTQLFKMIQIYALFCSITLFNLQSWTFSVINSSILNNSPTISKTFKNARKDSNTKIFFKDQEHSQFW